MLSAIQAEREPFDPSRRGNHAVYRENEPNHCPGCGRCHWLIGRLSAECAFCTTALPLAEAQSSTARVIGWASRPDYSGLRS